MELLQSTKTDAHAQFFDRKRVSVAGGQQRQDFTHARQSKRRDCCLVAQISAYLAYYLYPLSSVGQGHSSDFFCPSVHV